MITIAEGKTQYTRQDVTIDVNLSICIKSTFYSPDIYVYHTLSHDICQDPCNDQFFKEMVIRFLKAIGKIPLGHEYQLFSAESGMQTKNLAIFEALLKDGKHYASEFCTQNGATDKDKEDELKALKEQETVFSSNDHKQIVDYVYKHFQHKQNHIMTLAYDGFMQCEREDLVKLVQDIPNDVGKSIIEMAQQFAKIKMQNMTDKQLKTLFDNKDKLTLPTKLLK